jgi:hypothetical protein
MKKKQQHGFHVIELSIVAVVLLVLGFVGYRVLSKNTLNKVGGGNDWSRGCSGKGIVKMTHQPMDLKDVQSIIPAGTLAAEHVTPIDHLYFYPKDMQNRDAAPVYAMADGYLVDYSERSQNVGDGSARKSEYRIAIQHNCSIVSYFDLLTSLDSSITSKLKPGSGQRIEVKAGQVVGRVGAQSLDTAVYNFDMTLPGFVNPDSYKREFWKIHTDDFFKYFDEPLKSQMLALNPRKVEPRGGKIDYDIKGKLIGNWFKEGTNGYEGTKQYDGYGRDGKGYWSGHFAIVPDAINPSTVHVSFGDYQGRAKQFTAKTGSVDPAKVGPSDGLVKIEYVQYANPNMGPGMLAGVNSSLEGTLLVQLLDNGDKLKLEAFPGKAAADVSGFGSAASVCVR